MLYNERRVLGEVRASSRLKEEERAGEERAEERQTRQARRMDFIFVDFRGVQC